MPHNSAPSASDISVVVPVRAAIPATTRSVATATSSAKVLSLVSCGWVISGFHCAGGNRYLSRVYNSVNLVGEFLIFLGV